MNRPRVALQFGCCLLVAGTPVAQTAEAVIPPAVSESVQTLDAGFARLRRERADTVAVIEDARTRNREHERSASDADRSAALAAWHDTASDRRTLHRDIAEHLAAWSRALATLSAKQRTASTSRCGELVRNAILIGEPTAVLRSLKTECAALGGALSNLNAAARRDCLHAVAERLLATPGTSDLDVLVQVSEWSALFLRGTPPGKPLLDAFSTDLVLLFTERAADGRTLSKSTYYRPGAFLSSGFAAELRDDSNQVRHFCWALRMFARSTNPEGTMHLLELKESADALRRGLPVSKADLRLNAVTRSFAERALGRDPAPPLAIGAYAAALRRDLGT